MSNLSDIGFPVQNEQEVNEIIMKVVGNATNLPCPRGFYLKFSDESGAEIYVQGNENQELIGFNPHFAGKSKTKVSLTDSIERDSSELDGGFHCRANPDLEKIESGEFPFVFDVPDFRINSGIDLPNRCEIQLTAFASNDFKVFNDEHDYLASQTDGPKLAAKSFNPSGLFALEQSEEKDLALARPIAIFAGHIIDFDLKTNSFTGQKFYWFLVSTLCGELDVVADPKLVPEVPKLGGVVSGQFWLSGRLIS